MLPAISREVTLLAPVTVTALPIHLGRLRFYLLLLLLLTCTCEEAATATVMMMDDFEEEKYDQVTDARGTSGSSGASALDAKGLAISGFRVCCAQRKRRGLFLSPITTVHCTPSPQRRTTNDTKRVPVRVNVMAAAVYRRSRCVPHFSPTTETSKLTSFGCFLSLMGMKTAVRNSSFATLGGELDPRRP